MQAYVIFLAVWAGWITACNARVVPIASTANHDTTTLARRDGGYQIGLTFPLLRLTDDGLGLQGVAITVNLPVSKSGRSSASARQDSFVLKLDTSLATS